MICLVKLLRHFTQNINSCCKIKQKYLKQQKKCSIFCLHSFFDCYLSPLTQYGWNAYKYWARGE